MSKIKKYIKNPSLLYMLATAKGLMNWVDDETQLKRMFKISVGYPLDLSNPKTFNEKLQWLKLHDRNPLYSTLVDKYAVKKWVADQIGSEYITRSYARWESIDDIDISSLPKRFVLKTNHDCGGIVICSNKDSFNLAAAKKKLSSHMKRNYYWSSREWPYKNVKPCVFAEEYIDSAVCTFIDQAENLDLADYKVMCFSGEPKLIQVHRGRFNGTHTQDIYDANWRRTNITQCGLPMSDKPDDRPAILDEMLDLSRVLSKGLAHVRVDWFISNNGLRFGEMTFYDASGFDAFDDLDHDLLLGSWIDLSLAFDGKGSGE